MENWKRNIGNRIVENEKWKQKSGNVNVQADIRKQKSGNGKMETEKSLQRKNPEKWRRRNVKGRMERDYFKALML